MATNPFTAKTYIDKAKEDAQKKSSAPMSSAPVSSQTSSSTPPVTTTPIKSSSSGGGSSRASNTFTQKAQGYTPENATFDSTRVGTEVKEGLYVELEPSGKIKPREVIVSSRTPDFTGQDMSRNENARYLDGEISNRLTSAIERGEPNPVRSSVTGVSEVKSNFQPMTLKTQKSMIQASARAELESRRQKAIADYKRANIGKEQSYQYQYDVRNIQNRPLENFANVNAITSFSLAYGESARIVKENPQVLLKLEGGRERQVAGESAQMKADLIKKEIGGGGVTDFIYGNVAPVRLASEVISFLRGSKTQQSFARDIYKTDFEDVQLSGYESSKLSKNLAFGTVIGGGVVESTALIVGPELISERVAGRTLIKGLTNVGEVEAKSAFKPILKGTIAPAMKLGAREGAESVAFQNIASGSDIKPLEVGIGAGFGAVTVPVFLSVPLALQPTKPKTASVVRGVGEALEFGQETGGDILASKTRIFSNLEDVRLVQRVDSSSGKKMVSFTGQNLRRGRVVTPSFTNVFNPSIVPSNINTPTKSNIISLAVNSPSDTNIFSPASTRDIFSSNVVPNVSVPSNIDIPSESEVPVPVNVNVPSVVNSVVPTVVSNYGLPLIPPVFDLGGERLKGSQRQGKRYYNELALGLSLFGKESKPKKVSKKKVKKDNKSFRTKNFGFGSLGDIKIGRI